MKTTWILLKNIPFNSKQELAEVVGLPCETLLRLVNKKEKKESKVYTYSIRNTDSVLLIKKQDSKEDEASIQNDFFHQESIIF